MKIHKERRNISACFLSCFASFFHACTFRSVTKATGFLVIPHKECRTKLTPKSNLDIKIPGLPPYLNRSLCHETSAAHIQIPKDSITKNGNDLILNYGIF